MLLKMFSRLSSRVRHSASSAGCVFETMESRRLLSYALSVAAPKLTLTNNDVVPGNERMVFNRILHPNTSIPNKVHDKATLKLKNDGNLTLKFTSFTISGPWKITNTKPTSLAPGATASITLQFTASSPPTYTYNQTNGTTNTHKAGAYSGSLTIASNDPSHPKQVEQLAGWFQTDSENNEEPSLQSIINNVFNYKTNINSTHISTLSESSGKKLYGEETNSAYWTASNATNGVFVRQIAAFHTQGSQTSLWWYTNPTSPSLHKLFTTAGNEGQSFLPHIQGSSSLAQMTFKPGTSKFGFKIDGEWSDDKKNQYRSASAGGGHHVRFFPVRDHNGNLIANTYFMVMDYSVAGSENFDFQDAVYVISGIKPAGN